MTSHSKLTSGLREANFSIAHRHISARFNIRIHHPWQLMLIGPTGMDHTKGRWRVRKYILGSSIAWVDRLELYGD